MSPKILPIKPRPAWYGVSWPGGRRCNQTKEVARISRLPKWSKWGQANRNNFEEARRMWWLWKKLRREGWFSIVLLAPLHSTEWHLTLNHPSKRGVMPVVFNKMPTNSNIEKQNVLKLSIGTMHPCFRLAKKPALRKKAATSSLGDKDILYPYSSLKPTQNILQKIIFYSYLSVKPIQNIFQNIFFIPIQPSNLSRTYFKT